MVGVVVTVDMVVVLGVRVQRPGRQGRHGLGAREEAVGQGARHDGEVSCEYSL